MKITPIVLFLGFFLISGSILSQSKVVLINEIPTKVDIENNEIASIHESVPSYMKGYEKAPRDIFRKIWPGETVKLLAAAPKDPKSEVKTAITESDNAIRFNSDSYSLSENTKLNLDKLAQKILDSKSTSILLKSFYKLGDVDSQELTINRLDACKDYLQTKGIQGSLILTSFTGSENQTDKVSVDIK